MASVRSRLALEALAELSRGSEWIEADAVARRANANANLTPSSPAYFSAVGVGRMLSAIAEFGQCRKRLNDGGYMHVYKSNPEG